jgi:hypothetical protein
MNREKRKMKSEKRKEEFSQRRQDRRVSQREDKDKLFFLLFSAFLAPPRLRESEFRYVSSIKIEVIGKKEERKMNRGVGKAGLALFFVHFHGL